MTDEESIVVKVKSIKRWFKKWYGDIEVKNR